MGWLVRSFKQYRLGSRFCSLLIRSEHEKEPHSGGGAAVLVAVARNAYNAAAIAFAVQRTSPCVVGE